MDLKFLKIKTQPHPSQSFQLEYLEHHNAVAVLILDACEKETLLVKQYRPGKQGEVYEIPAGLIDKNEDSVEAMYREVREETGYSREDFEEIYLGKEPLLVSPGYTTEKLSFFILKLKSNDIQAKEQMLDEGEDLSLHWVKLEDVYKLSQDLKTQYTLNLYSLINKN